MATEEQNTGAMFEESIEEDRYLLFVLGHEIFGTPLLGVREVVEPLVPKPVPNTRPFFTGVINIRGEIVGVMDLRARFDHSTKSEPGQAMMVFETPSGTEGALVDRIESVAKISMKSIERQPNVKSSVPHEFLIGIAKEAGRLVTLIDLKKILEEQQVKI
jgi:purine-binding chemotaxis protein CheW